MGHPIISGVMAANQLFVFNVISVDFSGEGVVNDYRLGDDRVHDIVYRHAIIRTRIKYGMGKPRIVM